MPFLNGQQAYCGYCKEPCEIKWEDHGIGSYEFWGQTGNDEHWMPQSNCCDDTLWATPECLVEFDMKNWEHELEEPDDDY